MVRPGKRLRESYRPGCSSSVRSSIYSGYYNVSSEEGGGHESQRATVGLRTAGGRTRDAGRRVGGHRTSPAVEHRRHRDGRGGAASATERSKAVRPGRWTAQRSKPRDRKSVV